MITRRGLFRLLGAVAATPAMKPLEKLISKEPEFLSFGNIDPLLQKLAVEMNYRLALSLNALVALTYNEGLSS